MVNLEPKKKTAEYDQFIAWSALPSDMRVPPTQKELTKQLNVAEKTLSEWKNRDDFEKRKDELTKKWGRDAIPEIVNALIFKAKRGDTKAIEIFFEHIAGWVKKMEVEQPNVVQAILQDFRKIKEDGDNKGRPKIIEGHPPKEVSQ